MKFHNSFWNKNDLYGGFSSILVKVSRFLLIVLEFSTHMPLQIKTMTLSYGQVLSKRLSSLSPSPRISTIWRFMSQIKSSTECLKMGNFYWHCVMSIIDLGFTFSIQWMNSLAFRNLIQSWSKNSCNLLVHNWKLTFT